MDTKKKYPFPSNPPEDWLKAARKELGGKDLFAELTKEVNGLEIRPYYDATDLTFAFSDPLPAHASGYAGARAWVNAPLVPVENETVANQLALAHLNAGADGILFKVNTEVELSKLLKDIQLPFCSISFVDPHDIMLASLAKWLKDVDADYAKLSGAIFGQKFPQAQSLQPYEGADGFFPAGIEISVGSPTDELHEAVSRVVHHLSPLEDRSEANALLSNMSFRFSVGTDFFVEIAKLKTFRVLWRRLLVAYGIEKSILPHVHAVSETWKDEKLEPNANMLKATTATMAAVLGGADAITTLEETDQPFKARIARNVSSLLRDESRLALVSDPTAGSYYLESMIHQLSETVWQRLQNELES